MTDRTCCPTCGKDLDPDPDLPRSVPIDCPRCGNQCDVADLIGPDDDHAWTL